MENFRKLSINDRNNQLLLNIIVSSFFPIWFLSFVLSGMIFEIDYYINWSTSVAISSTAFFFIIAFFDQLSCKKFSLRVLSFLLILSLVLILFGGVKAHFNGFLSSSIDIWSSAALGISVAILNGLFSVFTNTNTNTNTDKKLWRVKISSLQKLALVIYTISASISVLTVVQVSFPLVDYNIVSNVPWLPFSAAVISVIFVILEMVPLFSAAQYKIKHSQYSKWNAIHCVLLLLNGGYIYWTFP
ncbi:hypothetical protein LCA30_26315 [Vibrio harveyi]|uniref:hypothetical protein n=1 Tax=Vibrio harveyi TaxID=669 RepID=UPI003BB488C7